VKTIDFYFDYTSFYGYLGAEKIGALAARYDRQVNWNPILLGIVFKVTGSPNVATMPLKGDYMLHDVVRSARFLGIPFRKPSKFPIGGQAASRITLWVRNQDPSRVESAVLALYRAYFIDDQDISAPEIAAQAVGKAGFNAAAALAATQDEAIKAQHKAEVEAAIARKVFGSPYMIIDGEPFWGADRLPQAEHWLKTGGF